MSRQSDVGRVTWRRGSLWLAAPLSLIAVAITALLVWGFLPQEPRHDSVSVVADLPGATSTVPATGGKESPPSGTGFSTSPPSGVTAEAVVSQPVGRPTRICIPFIGVDAEVVPVGLKEDGAMEVPPFGLAGWYSLGPVPGAAGPAVIVGHLDTRSGPDVFYRLNDLEPGDTITVTGEDGASATFVIEGKEQRLKTELPADRIWNDTPYPVLRLITCGGDFDSSTGHYRSNVIVYASLVQ